MKTSLSVFIVLTFAAAAAAAPPAVSTSLTMKDPTTSATAILTVSAMGEMSMTASKCVFRENFCGRYKRSDDACPESPEPVVTKVRMAAGVHLNDRSKDVEIALHADGTLAFHLSDDDACVNPAASADELSSQHPRLQIGSNPEKLGTIQVGADGKTVNLHAALGVANTDPECFCTNNAAGAAGKEDCMSHGEHHCTACTGAFFLDANECKPHTVDCNAQGKIIGTPASNTADAECGRAKHCECEGGTRAEGKACPAEGQAKCVKCPAGYGMVSADASCERCRKEDRKYSLGDDNSACADHTQCDVGSGSNFFDLADAETQQSSCEACIGSQFSDAEGYGSCQDHEVDCDADGKVVGTPASAEADTVCGADKQCACDQPDSTQGVGATGTDCPNNGDAKCTACTGEHYLDGDECKAWTPACGDGFEETQTPSNTQDRMCGDIDECESGGCGDAARMKCTNSIGSFSCEDINECDDGSNGGCGDPARVQCANQHNAAPQCEVIKCDNGFYRKDGECRSTAGQDLWAGDEKQDRYCKDTVSCAFVLGSDKACKGETTNFLGIGDDKREEARRAAKRACEQVEWCVGISDVNQGYPNYKLCESTAEKKNTGEGNDHRREWIGQKGVRPNTCTCNNGDPKQGFACTVDHAEQCASCEAGFYRNGNACTECSAQPACAGHERPVGACGGADGAQNDRACALKDCTCANGDKHDAASKGCTTHGAEMCKSCNAGFYGTACAECANRVCPDYTTHYRSGTCSDGPGGDGNGFECKSRTPVVSNAEEVSPGDQNTDRTTRCKDGFTGDRDTNPTSCTATCTCTDGQQADGVVGRLPGGSTAPPQCTTAAGGGDQCVICNAGYYFYEGTCRMVGPGYGGSQWENSKQRDGYSCKDTGSCSDVGEGYQCNKSGGTGRNAAKQACERASWCVGITEKSNKGGNWRLCLTDRTEKKDCWDCDKQERWWITRRKYCTCANGTPKDNGACSVHDAEQCASCNGDSYLEGDVCKKCVLPSCEADEHVEGQCGGSDGHTSTQNDQECVKTECQCDGGTETTDADCTRAKPQQQCASCDTDTYYMTSDQKCAVHGNDWSSYTNKKSCKHAYGATYNNEAAADTACYSDPACKAIYWRKDKNEWLMCSSKSFKNVNDSKKHTKKFNKRN